MTSLRQNSNQQREVGRTALRGHRAALTQRPPETTQMQTKDLLDLPGLDLSLLCESTKRSVYSRPRTALNEQPKNNVRQSLRQCGGEVMGLPAGLPGHQGTVLQPVQGEASVLSSPETGHVHTSVICSPYEERETSGARGRMVPWAEAEPSRPEACQPPSQCHPNCVLHVTKIEAQVEKENSKELFPWLSR